MFKVVEAFSGIGSQSKALKNIGIKYEILKTIEWDIYAFLAYDIIHNGTPNLREFKNVNKKDLLTELEKYTLSLDGKKEANFIALKRLNEDTLRHILCAIKRCNNLVSINDVNGEDIPDDTDLLTYSFPCQDLSIAHAWFGESGGIDRNANNRSGLLWEIERILKERNNNHMTMPRFLLMENVSNICSPTHNKNFKEWQNILEDMGYYNKIYILDSNNFGVPQKRTRVYMISVLCEDKVKKESVENYFESHDLKINKNIKIASKIKTMRDILKLNYENNLYLKEALENQPNDTESRRRIYENSNIIYDGENIKYPYALTLTTKQDRLPNSGIVKFESNSYDKSEYRYLTPRECFILMGFEESDFQKLIDNNFDMMKGRKFFTTEKLHKMAGNSIVVNVLEAIFNQIIDIENAYFKVEDNLIEKVI